MKNSNQTVTKIRKLEIEGRIFKCNTVKESIRDTKESKALQPDRIAPIQLHNLVPIALRYLIDTINLSGNRAKFLSIWKVCRVIPLQKTEKPMNIKASDQLNSPPPCKITGKPLYK